MTKLNMSKADIAKNDLKYMVYDQFCAWGTFLANVKNSDGDFLKLGTELARIGEIESELEYHKELRKLMNKYI